MPACTLLCAAGLGACGDGGGGTGVPGGEVRLTLTFQLPASADGGVPPGPARALERVDAVRVEVGAGGRILVAETVALGGALGTRTLTVDVAFEGERTTAEVSAALQRGSDVLFVGSTATVLAPGKAQDVLVRLAGVEAGFAVDGAPHRLRNLGETVVLSASTIFATGDPLEPVEATWRSLDPAVARVDSGPALTAVANGTTEVMAEAGGRSATAAVSVFDGCFEAALSLAFGGDASGELERARDCFDRQTGRLQDDFRLTVEEARPFQVTLSTTGYFPFVPLYRDGVQVSGWASPDETTIAREYLFPPGEYVVRASSLAKGASAWDAPAGPYRVSTTPVAALPQEGCGEVTSVTYGTVARGRVTADDCEDDTGGDPAIPRRRDGYDILLEPGRPLEVLVTAEVPFRASHWVLDAFVEERTGLAAGDTARFAATGVGFRAFFVGSESADAAGAYTLIFTDAPGASVARAGAHAARSRVATEARPHRTLPRTRPPTW